MSDMCIYLLESNGKYKIGITGGRISARVSQLQTGNPFPINIVHVAASPISSKLEKLLHGILNDKNIKGEWFELSKEWVDFIEVFFSYVRCYNFLKEQINEVEPVMTSMKDLTVEVDKELAISVENIL